MALDPILDLPIANPLSGSEWTPVVQLQGPPFFPVEVTCRTTVAAIGLLAEAATVPWPVSIGGTGSASLAQYGLLYGNGTSPIGVTAVGLSSQVLVGNSAAAPSWSGGTEGELLTVHSGAVSWLPAGVNGQVLAGSSGTLPTWVQGTSGQYLGINGAGNVAFLTSGGPTTVTTISFDGSGLTPDVPAQGDVVMGGILNAATGGTGNSSLTADAVLIGNGTSATTDTGVGGAGTLLQGTGAVPSWLTAPTDGAIMIGASLAPSWLSIGTSGQILQVVGGAPAWGSIPGTGVATISFGTTGLTPNSATSGAVTVSGTLAVANGGTGLATITANAVPIGNGTSAPTLITGTSAQILVGGTPPAFSGTLPFTLPITSGGTGSTSATGTGIPVLATSPTISNPTLTAVNGNALAGFRNRIINGGMSIDQRNQGASQLLTTGVAYNVDRMFGYCTGNGGSGQRITSAGVSGTPSLYAYQFTGAVGVTGIGFGQRIRAANSFDLAGGSATLSVNLANSLLTTVTWTAYYATATDNFSSLTSISTGTFTVTSTLTNYAATISVPSAATTGIEILLTVGAQTSGTWTIGDLQLEPGGHVTPFERRPNELEQHLCEAYCPVITGFGTSGSSVIGASGFISSAANGLFSFPFRTTPRVVPTGIVVSNVGNFALESVGGNAAATGITLINASLSGAQLQVVTASSSLTGGQGAFLNVTNANALIVFTGCEL